MAKSRKDRQGRTAAQAHREYFVRAREALAHVEELLNEQTGDALAGSGPDWSDVGDIQDISFRLEQLAANMRNLEWHEVYDADGLLPDDGSLDDRPLAQGDGWVVANVD